MRIISIGLGTKYAFKYETGLNEKTLKCTEEARPEFREAIRELENTWSEKACRDIYGTDLETLAKRVFGDRYEKDKKPSFLHLARLELLYDPKTDDFIGYKLAGLLQFPRAFGGEFSTTILYGIDEALDGTLWGILGEAEKYINGQRAQETLPGLEENE